MTIAPVVPADPPRARRFSLDEYHRMAEDGFFKNQRVELIDGEILEMPAQLEPHVMAISSLIQISAPQIKSPFMLRCQAPLSIGNSQPEPDIAIVRLPAPLDAPPHTAVLVIEVSNTSLTLDRQKAHLYASAQVPEYWLVNLVERAVECYTGPIHDPDSPFLARYSKASRHLLSQSMQPQFVPVAAFPIAALFHME